ncbi:MAG: uroporphyrinogen-III synthase [Pyrinomonadaceae bacterium]|nr:uroporphyrinogen-III synthase [Pyrinomonadaceae bacterium]
MNVKTYGIFATNANKKIIESLEDVITFPAVEFERIEFETNNLNDFDWLVFPDIFSVDCFLQTLETQHFDLFELDNLRIFASSESISDKLRFQQIHADVIPQKNDVETSFQAIKDYENPDNLNFLILQENTKIEQLLKDANANVSAINTYKINEIPQLTKLKSLIKGGAIDEFIFTSPEDVFALNYISDLSNLDLVFSATDGNTFQTLREFNIKPILFK